MSLLVTVGPMKLMVVFYPAITAVLANRNLTKEGKMDNFIFFVLLLIEMDFTLGDSQFAVLG